MLSFLPSCYSSYGAWTLTPVGLAPTDHASLRWTHTSRYLSSPSMSALAILQPSRTRYAKLNYLMRSLFSRAYLASWIAPLELYQ